MVFCRTYTYCNNMMESVKCKLDTQHSVRYKYIIVFLNTIFFTLKFMRKGKLCLTYPIISGNRAFWGSCVTEQLSYERGPSCNTVPSSMYTSTLRTANHRETGGNVVRQEPLKVLDIQQYSDLESVTFQYCMQLVY